MKKATIVYFSHGGGPLPILGEHSLFVSQSNRFRKFNT